MKPEVIVDTSVWIEYFRRPDSEEKRGVDFLLENNRALLPGIILAELLQGTRDEREFDLLLSCLDALPFCQSSLNTRVRAGHLSHLLRT